ncbi:hypothetical protein HN51_052162 [Arachis hypogaea]|uniref:DNA replication checkpoint mediator MRC1 domain-containing protein n=1 Tax=Arachis hypogaea TaxID=3818 RepID=A0A445CBU3_ARAHY|nr:glutamic acid-rich protein isoform X2 [Arachis ipaensis]XP_025667437.1 glutamic acid-rich protein isoform X2 [Arachis hypogaea]XP_025667438.1 glutamic acid-rich protein isoform X3 [Arachis hypogaea]QHN93448.1 uncharacterized protein DS421_17g592770 [Arachis hypogaea]RYR48415.1 hypothetical protein Ahy_A07g034438 isoform C [Arachis hypogaea]
MESDEDFELLPPPPLHEPKPKLKRLKKALRVPPLSPSNHDGSSPIDSGTLPSDGPTLSAGHVEDSNWGSNPQIDHRVTAHLDASDSDTAKKNNGFGAMRALDFDSIGDGLDGNDEVHSKEMETENEKGEEVADLEIDDRDRKRRSLDEDSEDQEKKRKRKKKKGLDGEKQLKESASNKRRAEKERRENLKQLQAESQRLLRETRDAAFKPIPLVQKPISSILDKIRQRKLEIQKKSSGYRDDNGYDSPVDDDSERGPLDEEISDKVEKAKLEETHTSCAAIDNLNTLHVNGSKEAADYPSGESIPSPMAVRIEPEHEFRAPIDDTQELAYHSQSTDTNDVCEEPINTSEEVPASSMLAMNLKLDSAPPDDDASSDDDEDDDKENIDPRLHGSVHLPSPPSGDPVKAFVDEEAEEEDNSDNDMQRFQDNEEGEDDDDIGELNEMITPEYEEKSIDREKRDQLHQKWLEQQDTAGMDNLLHKLNCGSKLKEPTLIEEEDEEGEEAENESDEEAENESDEEAEEYIAPSDAVKINLKKAKQMIPQMFTDKDNDYVSSDDEEAEKMLDKQCLIDKSEERAAFLSPAEDESSREVFSLIKKLNIVPDTKRKAKVPSFFETSLLGQKVNTSSKSFVGRATNHFMATSQKHGSAKVRSFIFGRDDSSSRLSASMSEDSSEMIQRESQPAKAVSAKFQRSTQKISATLNSTTQESSVSLLDILRRSSLRAEHFVQNVKVQPKESVFDAFKLAKKPIKTDAGI